MSERVRVEFETLIETLDYTDRAWLHSVSEDRLQVTVAYDVKTLYRVGGGAGVGAGVGVGDARLVEQREGAVRMLFQLHPEHPQVPPFVVARTPDLFNVHIFDPACGDDRLPPIPVVCLGAFEPHMRIADWIAAGHDLLRWERVATERPLNEAAAEFYRRESATPGRFPIDPRPLWRTGAPPDGTGQHAARAPGSNPAGPGLRLGSSWRSA